MLAQDVRALAKDESAPEHVRSVAKQLAKRYGYPVDFQIIDTSGKMYAQAEANKHSQKYLPTLRKGLE